MSQSLARIRLYGKKVTEDELAKEISNQLLGNKARGILPKTVQEVARDLDITRKTVYNYRDLAVELKLLEVDESGEAKLPEIPTEEDFKRYTLEHEITKDPLVQEWIADLMHRRGSGKPRANWKSFVTAFETICNTLKVSPRQFLTDTKAPEQILKNFRDCYMKGEIDSRRMKTANPSKVEGAMYTKVCAVRDFCGVFNITWKKGVTGIMNARVINHGKYADVRLMETPELNEYEWCFNYLIEKFGLDSDELRIFGFGVESGARAQTIMQTLLEWTESTSKKGVKTYHLIVYESKTKHINEGKWTKYIRDPRTQESLRLAKAKGYTLLWDNNKFKSSTMKRRLDKTYREMYLKLGKTSVYFIKRPYHSFKHIASQRYLRKTKWNLAFTAVLVGSNGIDELKKSYGEMPPEVVAELMEEYF